MASAKLSDVAGRLKVACFRDQHANRFVRVADHSFEGTVPYASLKGSGKAAEELLAEQGVVLMQSEIRHLQNAIPKDATWPEETVASSVGWTNEHFALPDGSIETAGEGSSISIAFAPRIGKCSSAGSLDRWVRGVGARLAEHQICLVVLLFALTAPLLRFSSLRVNILVQLVGEPGTGKSTLLEIISSIIGNPDVSDFNHYMINGDATPAALEAEMSLHRDLPMLMDGFELHGIGNAKRDAVIDETVMRFFQGNPRGRHQLPAGERNPFSAIWAANETLLEVIPTKNAKTRATLSRVITLLIDGERPYGVYDHLPDGVSSAAELAQELVDAARRNYGVALRKYINRISQRLIANGAASVRRIVRRQMDAFIDRVEANGNDGREQRIVEPFALAFAGGELAKVLGILPADTDTFGALEVHFRRALIEAIPLTFRQRVAAHVQRHGVQEMSSRRLACLSEAELNRLAGFVTSVKGQRLLFIPDEALRKAFSDWPAIRKQMDVTALLSPDKGRVDKRSILIGGRKVRFVAIKWDDE